MAKIGLAAELAKQAARAAREEIEGTMQPSVTAAPARWKVPVLPGDFDVETAVSKATDKVAAHYHQLLAGEGLEVQVVAAPPQGMPQIKADVREGGTGRLVRAYTAQDLLGMFAVQQATNGVVVDGNV